MYRIIFFYRWQIFERTPLWLSQKQRPAVLPKKKSPPSRKRTRLPKKTKQSLPTWASRTCSPCKTNWPQLSPRTQSSSSTCTSFRWYANVISFTAKSMLDREIVIYFSIICMNIPSMWINCAIVNILIQSYFYRSRIISNNLRGDGACGVRWQHVKVFTFC